MSKDTSSRDTLAPHIGMVNHVGQTFQDNFYKVDVDINH